MTEECAGWIAVVADTMLGTHNRQILSQRSPGGQNVRPKSMGMNKVCPFLQQDAREPGNVRRPKTTPEIRQRVFSDSTTVPNAHPSIRKQCAELWIGCHQCHAVIRTRQVGPRCQVCEQTLRAACLARNHDVSNYRTLLMDSLERH